MNTYQKFPLWLLAVLLLFLNGCGGGSDSSVTVAPSSGGGSVTTPVADSASALLLFDLTGQSAVLGRIADQAATYRVTVVKADGDVVKTLNSARVDRLLVDGIPAGPTLLRTEFLNATGQVIGYLDRFTTLVAGQTAVLELTGFVSGIPPQGTPVFPAVGTVPTRLVFTAVPSSVAPGTPFGVSVLVLDANGAPVPTAQGEVSLTSNGPTLAGTTTVSLREGVATFEALTASGSIGTFALAASATVGGQSLRGESLDLSLSAGPTPPNVGVPATLRFVSVPTAGTAGADLTTVEVEVLDVYGQRVSTSGLSVTLSLGQNPLPPDGAVLSGALSQAVNSGLASFPGLRLDRAGAYRFHAAAAGVVGASTAVFTVSAAPPEPSVPGTGLFDGVMVFARTGFSYDEGAAPRDVLSGDFDGDSIVDLVMVRKLPSKQILFAKGHGDGTFGLPIASSTALRMETAAAADLDGDGDLDLVATSFESSGVARVYLNNGTGGFTEQPALGSGAGCYELCLADFNGNGTIDIVTVNRDAATVTFFSNLDGASFASGVSYGVDPMPVGVACADLDADGDVDLAVTHVAAGTVSLLENSAGSFSLRGSLPMGDGAFGVTLADLNGDTRPDLATANRDAGTVTIRLATGAFTFGDGQSHPVGQLPYSVVSGDFDNDGRPDLASANFGSGSATVLRNGSGSWTSQTVPVGSGPLKLSLADFDRDGYIDITSANYNEASALIRINDGQGGFQLPTSIPVEEASNVLCGDLDGDGKLDLLILTQDMGAFLNSFEVRFGTGDGTFVSGVQRSLGVNLSQPRLVDLDSDGDLDLVGIAGSGNTSYLAFYYNDGAGVFGVPLLQEVYAAGYYAIGDLNGDGWADAVVSLHVGSPGVLVYLNDGSGSLVSAPVQGWTPTQRNGLALGDFDGDGLLDLVIDEEPPVIRRGNGDGTFGAPVSLGTTAPYKFELGDLNNDGALDIVGMSSGSVVVFMNNGVGAFLSQTMAAPARVASLGLWDLNSDGFLDVVATNGENFYAAESVYVNSYSVFFNDGSGALGVPVSYRQTDSSYDWLDPTLAGGDIDEDGDIDLIGVDSTPASVQIFWNR